MAQLERRKRISETPKTPKSQTSPTFEQLLRVEEAYWSSTTSPTVRISHDLEECPSPSHNKKSVLTKVKERAKKLRHSLSGKKKHEIDPSNNDHSTPPWGVTLDDDSDDEQDDDPEYLGAPMYESEAAPESLKETARQHPRAVPVVSENHRVPNRTKQEAAPENEKPVSPSMTMTEAVTEKLAPAYAVMSDATHKLASKLAGLAIATQETQSHAQVHGGALENVKRSGHIAVPPSQGSEAKNMGENAGNLKQYAASSPQTWDKGVSVKEYFLHKLEPGEDERALSQAITEAISPRTTTRDTGVVEKVKEAVTSFFWQEENANSMAKAASLSSATPVSSNIPTSIQQNRIALTNANSSEVHYPASANSSPLIPLSTNAYEVHEEENHGKILQTN